MRRRGTAAVCALLTLGAPAAAQQGLVAKLETGKLEEGRPTTVRVTWTNTGQAPLLVERIVIEASGVADPAQVAAYGDRRRVPLDAVITLADPADVARRIADPHLWMNVQAAKRPLRHADDFETGCSGTALRSADGPGADVFGGGGDGALAGRSRRLGYPDHL